MALIPGSVTITANATTGAPSYSGSGLSLALAQQYLTAYLAQSPAPFPAVPSVGHTSAPWSAERPATSEDIATMVSALQKLYDAEALRASAYAAAICTQIATNARTKVQTADVCGRLPATLTPGADIQGPSGTVYLTLE